MEESSLDTIHSLDKTDYNISEAGSFKASLWFQGQTLSNDNRLGAFSSTSKDKQANSQHMKCCIFSVLDGQKIAPLLVSNNLTNFLNIT
jgi:hypothetical protein